MGRPPVPPYLILSQSHGINGRRGASEGPCTANHSCASSAFSAARFWCRMLSSPISLLLTVRDAIPKVRELATAEFATLRLRLLKVAARVVETASRIRLAFAAACPEADLFRSLPGALLPLGP